MLPMRCDKNGQAAPEGGDDDCGTICVAFFCFSVSVVCTCKGWWYGACNVAVEPTSAASRLFDTWDAIC